LWLVFLKNSGEFKEILTIKNQMTLPCFQPPRLTRYCWWPLPPANGLSLKRSYLLTRLSALPGFP
jgi:hypothetical protein